MSILDIFKRKNKSKNNEKQEAMIPEPSQSEELIQETVSIDELEETIANDKLEEAIANDESLPSEVYETNEPLLTTESDLIASEIIEPDLSEPIATTNTEDKAEESIIPSIASETNSTNNKVSPSDIEFNAISSEMPRQSTAEENSKKTTKKQGLFAKLKDGLRKTRDTLLGGLFVENGEKIDDEFYDELEEAMIISDMGINTTQKLLAKLRKELKEKGIHTKTEARLVMIKLLSEAMQPDSEFLADTDKAVIMIVGVNGVGKTTSIGKLAAMYKAEGKTVMLAAADTFRAAAAEQLTIWAERADVPIVKHGEGADPAAVVFDSIASYKAKNCNILICDTAGRLHNKINLMNELSKMRRIIGRDLPDVPVEVLLVLDATTGQNAIAQAKVFGENAGLTGIILTKLDGTAKGGVVVAVKDELQLPVRFVGVGEGIDDLQPFDAEAFAQALI